MVFFLWKPKVKLGKMLPDLGMAKDLWKRSRAPPNPAAVAEWCNMRRLPTGKCEFAPRGLGGTFCEIWSLRPKSADVPDQSPQEQLKVQLDPCPWGNVKVSAGVR